MRFPPPSLINIFNMTRQLAGWPAGWWFQRQAGSKTTGDGESVGGKKRGGGRVIGERERDRDRDIPAHVNMIRTLGGRNQGR